MLTKLCVLICVLQPIFCQKEQLDWDLAVATDDRIELLQANGSFSGEPFGHFSQFTKLKALTFDNIRHRFIVSDMEQQNDTIFTVQLTKETDVKSIIEDLPDDVQGLAIDPISDILYWSDSVNRTINYVHLNDSTFQARILFAFTNENPQDITVDVCHRYLYWSNSDINNPSIERAKLGTTKRETLVDTGLHRPAGLAIDYYTQRLYWADIKEGIYYTIESTDLEGNQRQVVYEGIHARPFGVSVDKDSIYWTDSNNNILWRLAKNQKEPVPEEIRHFMERPMGIITKNSQIKTLPQCEELSKAIIQSNVSSEEVFKEEVDSGPCFNGGVLIDGTVCHCVRGFTGKLCEISLCYNYCLHGQCHTSSLGFPQCRCLKGFGGKKCDRDICENFCLNDGSCSRNDKLPVCTCPKGFKGQRCEEEIDICEETCKDGNTDEKEISCKCSDFGEVEESRFSSLPLKEDFLDHFQDTAFLVLSCLVLIMSVLIVILAAYACSLRRRPRIKKRFIVNKNVTPLTYRPQQTAEQCEITIENCCNMNICETPCFEPPKLACLQSKNEDKKKLLLNIENGDDVY